MRDYRPETNDGTGIDYWSEDSMRYKWGELGETLYKLQGHTTPSFHHKERKIYTCGSQSNVRGEPKYVEGVT